MASPPLPTVVTLPNTPSPKVTVALNHPSAPKNVYNVSTTVDTGFTGFLQLPLPVTASVMLPLGSEAPMTLANGKIGHFPVGITTVKYGGKTVFGLTIAAPDASPVLVGMEFLKRFGYAVLASPHLPQAILLNDPYTPAQPP